MRFVNIKLYQDLKRAERFINAVSNDIATGGVCFWGICLIETKEIIGTICLWNVKEDGISAEIGYELLTNHQGNGYMREAVYLVIEYALKEIKLERIEAVTHKDHHSSQALLLHFGFEHQGFAKDVYPESEDEPDMIVYRLLNQRKAGVNQ